jgi:CHAD domain-containing protein
MPDATTQIVTTLSRALRRSAAACATESRRARRGGTGAVHRLRVASRRLRAAVPLAAKPAGVAAGEVLRDLRRMTRAFGVVRELDVARELLAKFVARDPWAASALACVDDHCAALRKKALETARKRLSHDEARLLRSHVDALADRVLARNRGRETTLALLAEVSRRARDVSVAMDHAGTVYGLESLHRVRIAAKKLRYTLELAGGVLGPASERTAVRVLKRLQAKLGAIHDMQVAQQHLRTVASAPETGVTFGADLARVDQEMEIQCRRLHAQMVKRKPEVEGIVVALRRDITRRVGMRDLRRPVRMRPSSVRRTRAAS